MLLLIIRTPTLKDRGDEPLNGGMVRKVLPKELFDLPANERFLKAVLTTSV